jgi:Acyl carrier protein
MDTMENTITAIVAEVGEIDEGIIEPEKTLRDVGIDSLMGIIIAVEVEKKYKVSFSDSELKSLLTLNDIILLTRTKLQVSEDL